MSKRLAGLSNSPNDGGAEPPHLSHGDSRGSQRGPRLVSKRRQRTGRSEAGKEPEEQAGELRAASRGRHAGGTRVLLSFTEHAQRGVTFSLRGLL